MKPFRVYEVVAGGLWKVTNKIKHDYNTLADAIEEVGRLQFHYTWAKDKQFVIQEYTSSNCAKIVKIIEAV